MRLTHGKFPRREYPLRLRTKEITAMQAAVKLQDWPTNLALAGVRRTWNSEPASCSLATVHNGQGRARRIHNGSQENAARLGASLRRRWPGRPLRQLTEREIAPARRSSWPHHQIIEGGQIKRTASCAGNALTSTPSSPPTRHHFHERYVGALLKKLGFSHISTAPCSKQRRGGGGAYKKKLKRH